MSSCGISAQFLQSLLGSILLAARKVDRIDAHKSVEYVFNAIDGKSG